MRFPMVLALTATIWLGMASESKAQSSLYHGPMGYGTSPSMSGTPYGSSYATSGMMGGSTYYSPGYYSSPGTFAYGSGYRGYTPTSSLYNGYSYGNYGTGVRTGFHPFRAWKRNY